MAIRGALPLKMAIYDVDRKIERMSLLKMASASVGRVIKSKSDRWMQSNALPIKGVRDDLYRFFVQLVNGGDGIEIKCEYLSTVRSHFICSLFLTVFLH
ncbi:hypothetical protein GWI33_000055 [Rhynchophorus ferrugineus]|uniref:Uncharacterized protein n=1 Tax=Rhynchophorus ferrugineus TaxID=354439 RepID=A0A834J0K7_RHYFE|nr:hypothetical protein GWI33_000055 [Rhynchophorus ferrugineus]